MPLSYLGFALGYEYSVSMACRFFLESKLRSYVVGRSDHAIVNQIYENLNFR